MVKKELIYFHKFNPSIPFIDPAIVLTMFALSFIFIFIVWIFWWEVNLCRPVFYHWFIHVLPLEIQLFRGENCDTINWFIHVLPLEIQLFRGEDCDTINWFIHVLPLEIQLFRGEDCDTINWFTPTTFLCLSQFKPWISKVVCCVLFWFVFSELRSEVIVPFVDIGRIVDHHCFNFFS